MKREAPLRCLLALIAAGTSCGCSFLIDFDELQSGTPSPDTSSTDARGGDGGDAGKGGDDGVGGTPNAGAPSGGTSGEGGTPGEGACPEGCDDGDPCTIDTCTETGCDNTEMECEPSDTCNEATCVDGACQETPISGVVPDDYEDIVFGDSIYRSEVVAADGRFFTAVFGTFSGVNDLLVGAFDATDAGELPRTQSLARSLMEADFEVASPAALVADERVDVELNVYVAVRDLLGDDTAPGDVLRIRFDRELELISMNADRQGSAPSYRFISDRVGPAAAQLPDGDPFVVWPGTLAGAPSQDGLFVQLGTTPVNVSAPGNNFIPTADPLAGLVALHSDTSVGAAWMTNPAAGGVGLFTATTSGAAPAELAQCHDDTAFTGYSLHGARTLDDLWTISWAKTDGDAFLAENTLVSCVDDTCADISGVDVGSTCSAAQIDSRVTEDVRNLVVESFSDGSDPDLLYQVIQLAAPNSVALVVNRLDISAGNSATTERIGSATLSAGDGGDWPEVAVVPPDKIGVSWIQPSADGGGEEVHFARYRICE